MRDILIEPFCPIKINNENPIGIHLAILHHIIKSSDIFYKNRHESFKTNRVKECCEGIIKSYILTKGSKKSFFIHEELDDSKSCCSLLGAIDIHEYEAGNIKQHELTEDQKVENMAFCLEECPLQSEPVILFFDSNKWKNIEKYLEFFIQKASLVYDFFSVSGRRHKFWEICREEDIEIIKNIFKKLDYLYIGDGHHRIRALKDYNNIIKLGNDITKEKASVKIFANIISSRVVSTTRFIRVYDFNILCENYVLDLIELIKKYFYIKEVKELFLTKNKFQIAMAIGSQNFFLVLRKEYHNQNTISSVEIFNKYIAPILYDKKIKCEQSFLFYGEKYFKKEGFKKLEYNQKILFSFCSPNIDEIISVSNKNKNFPQKSTFIEPKIEEGIIFMMG